MSVSRSNQLGDIAGKIGGWAPLDSGLLVPIANLPIGSSGSQLAAGNHAWGVSNLASASYQRTSGDYTTTSTTFVDVDTTNMTLSITTGAHRVLIGFTGTIQNNAQDLITYVTVMLDGINLGNASGFVMAQKFSGGASREDGSFAFLTNVLSAASHTFKLQWRVNGGTATLRGGSSGEPAAQFWVMEQVG